MSSGDSKLTLPQSTAIIQLSRAVPVLLAACSVRHIAFLKVGLFFFTSLSAFAQSVCSTTNKATANPDGRKQSYRKDSSPEGNGSEDEQVSQLTQTPRGL